MTWSYSDPSKSIKDHVRFLIGDTDINQPILSDEEINAEAADEGNAYLVGSRLCNYISARYARYVDGTLGDLNQLNSQRVKQFQELAVILRRRAFESLVPAYGDMGTSDYLKKPAFRRHQMDDYFIDT